MEQKFKVLNKNHKAMIRRKGLVPENYRLLKELNYALGYPEQGDQNHRQAQLIRPCSSSGLEHPAHNRERLSSNLSGATSRPILRAIPRSMCVFLLLLQFLSDIPGTGWGARNTTEVCMNTNEARQIVETGLERRKAERERKEAQLEQQERILRLKINDNHSWKTMSEAQQEQIRKDAEAEYKKLRAEKRAQKLARELQTEDIIQKSILTGLSILLAAGIFRLNVFVALSLVLGLAVFPAVKIFHLYFPLEEVSK